MEQKLPKGLDERYGKTHTAKKVMGLDVNLKSLKDNESVVYGDGETYHWLLTKKPSSTDD